MQEPEHDHPILKQETDSDRDGGKMVKKNNGTANSTE